MTKEISIDIKTHKNKYMEQKTQRTLDKRQLTMEIYKKSEKILCKNTYPLIQQYRLHWRKRKKTEILAETFEQVYIIDPSLNPEETKIVEKVNNYLEQNVQITNTEIAKIITNPDEIIKIIKK